MGGRGGYEREGVGLEGLSGGVWEEQVTPSPTTSPDLFSRWGGLRGQVRRGGGGGGGKGFCTPNPGRLGLPVVLVKVGFWGGLRSHAGPPAPALLSLWVDAL